MKYFYENYPSNFSEKANNTVKNSYLVEEHLYSGESKFQKIDVIYNAFYGRALFLDELMMTTEKDEFIYHESLSHIPISKVKEPKKVLIIGGGDGGIARELAKYKSIEEINLVEIDEAVIKVSKEYLPSIACGFSDTRVNVYCQDGAKFVENEKEASYDLILVDSSDPVGPGIVLFEEPFYKNCKRILKTEGQFSAQAMGAFIEPKAQKYMFNNLSKVFKYINPYYAVIPTYPSSLWLFLHASNIAFNDKILNPLPENLKYVNTALINSVYSIPEFIKTNLYS